MAIEVTSTTDTQEQIDAANGKQVEQKPSESAPTEEADETKEDSETSEESEAESKEKAEDEETDESHEEDDEKADGKKAKVPKGVKKRLGRLTKKVTDAQREAEYWKAEALKRQKEEREEKPVPKAESASEPQEEDFENHKDYVKALAKWTVDQERKADAEKNKEVQAKSAFEAQIQAHNERIAKFREETPEFSEVIADFVEDHGDVQFSSFLENALMESELGPALILELAKNPEEFKRINSLGFAACNRALGQIEAKLSQKSSSKEQPNKDRKSVV